VSAARALVGIIDAHLEGRSLSLSMVLGGMDAGFTDDTTSPVPIHPGATSQFSPVRGGRVSVVARGRMESPDGGGSSPSASRASLGPQLVDVSGAGAAAASLRRTAEAVRETCDAIARLRQRLADEAAESIGNDCQVQ
jgi:hypothetical protein